jgi:hypothetical protein
LRVAVETIGKYVRVAAARPHAQACEACVEVLQLSRRTCLAFESAAIARQLTPAAVALAFFHRDGALLLYPALQRAPGAVTHHVAEGFTHDSRQTRPQIVTPVRCPRTVQSNND